MADQDNDKLVEVARTRDAGITITRRRRDVQCVYVLVSELKILGSANMQFALFSWLTGLTFGLLAATAITLLTVAILSPFIFAAFIAILTVSLLLTLAFGTLMIIHGLKARRQINDITGQEEIEHTQVISDVPIE